MTSLFNAICGATLRFGPLLARLFIGAIFIPAGIGKITGFSATAGFMASKGLPFPDVLLVLTILIEVVASLMVVVGWRAREAAFIIFLFLIPVTLIFHAFWVDPAQQSAFFKNLGIMGCLLYISACGAGRYSVNQGKSVGGAI